MLAGELVGASGSVVGIDRNAQVVAVAKERAQAAGFLNVAFEQASVNTFSDPEPFDLVIGRYVLVYQVDPAAFIHAAARFARPGGIVALHEFIAHRPLQSLPRVELWQQASDWLLAAFRAGTPNPDAAGRLIEHFSAAGLSLPTLSSETPVGGGVDAPHYAWIADVVRTLVPQMVQAGVATADAMAVETLESRLRSAVVEARSQVEGPVQVCAWART
jgi:SAM-dependent methyltransferase